ncbi:MAG: hypothetical protein AB8U91_04955, partial [Candidatus Midichloria sp.]
VFGDYAPFIAAAKEITARPNIVITQVYRAEIVYDNDLLNHQAGVELLNIAQQIGGKDAVDLMLDLTADKDGAKYFRRNTRIWN